MLVNNRELISTFSSFQLIQSVRLVIIANFRVSATMGTRQMLADNWTRRWIESYWITEIRSDGFDGGYREWRIIETWHYQTTGSAMMRIGPGGRVGRCHNFTGFKCWWEENDACGWHVFQMENVTTGGGGERMKIGTVARPKTLGGPRNFFGGATNIISNLS